MFIRKLFVFLYKLIKMDEKQTKMVIVVRKDLKNKKGEKVRSGKITSQCSHSALGFIWNNLKGNKICFELSEVQYNWYKTGQTKITLQVKDEAELVEIYKSATEVGLDVTMITDEGRTEFEGPTKTCLSIGPDYSEKIDSITKHLQLF